VVGAKLAINGQKQTYDINKHRTMRRQYRFVNLSDFNTTVFYM